MTHAERFEKIASEAIIEAEAVKCSSLDFVAGLRSIMISIRERLEQAESESKED
jgi:hypothetical protein